MAVNTNDEVFVEAPREDVYRALITFGKDPSWWPGARVSSEGTKLNVSVPAGRGRRVRFDATVEGVRPDEGLVWAIERGELTGRGEWWLESFKDGTIVHYFLEAAPASGFSRAGTRVRRHRWAIRRGMNALKDASEYEHG